MFFPPQKAYGGGGNEFLVNRFFLHKYIYRTRIEQALQLVGFASLITIFFIILS